MRANKQPLLSSGVFISKKHEKETLQNDKRIEIQVSITISVIVFVSFFNHRSLKLEILDMGKGLISA